MRRAPVVAVATGAGLAAVLSYHTATLKLGGTLAAGRTPIGSPPAGAAPGGGSSTTSAPGPTTTTPSPATSSIAGPAGAAAPPTTAPPTKAAPTTAPPTTAPPAAGAPASTSASRVPAATSSPAPSAPVPAATAPVASSPTTTRPPSTTTTTVGTRSANGALEQYRYGDLELRVTISGNRIVDVEPVVDDPADPRSQEINAQAEPMLRQQALQAQSANIDGVSGATYTSQAYVDSLQSALDKLGFHG